MKAFFDNFLYRYFSAKTLPYWVILALDSCIVIFSGLITRYIEVGGNGFVNQFWQFATGLIVTVCLFFIGFKIFHTYSHILRYSSFSDLFKVASATLVGSTLTYLCSLFINPNNNIAIILPGLRESAILFALTTMFMWVVRVVVKSIFDSMRRDINTQRTFIYGVKSVGVGLAKNIKNQTPQRYSLAGFISPDGELVGQYLVGAKVYKDDETLIKNLINKRAKVVMVSSLQTEHFRTRQDLINSLIDHNIKIMMIPEEIAWDGKTDFHTEQLREVDIEDLLPRDKIEVDMEAIGNQLRDKVILITGAAGSIGSEIVRQVAKFNPKKMILIDHAETPMHDIRLMMASQFAYISSESIVASITNKELMEEIFKAGRPDYVFHAAAYKHVPMMEDNPSIAVQNNVYGTRVIADLAVKYRTKKFVMISTDKAVNPTNVMGCSKRICEIYCQSLNKAIVEGQVEGITQFVTTRFGNVLGSNGSVIPIFKEQIKKGGPITVTHPEIIRFFMLIPEACRLVLEAGTMGQGGEIYVFDMGKPVKIVDLAKRMIKLSGAQNIEIKFSGLREGEKLYEEVLSDKEQTKPTRNPKIMIAKVREYDYELAVKNEDRLREASYTFDDMAIVRIMKEIVPEYKSQHSKYEVLDVERGTRNVERGTRNEKKSLNVQP